MDVLEKKKKEKIGIMESMLGLATFSLAVGGCSLGSNQDQPVVAAAQTSLYLSGSAQPTTVAKTFPTILLEALLPQASALIPSSLVDSQDHPVVLNLAWMAVKEIEFKSEESGTTGEESEVEFQGPYFVDLLSVNPSPLDTSQVAIKDIRRIKMKLEPAGENTVPVDAPAELATNSIVLTGTVGGVNFTYISDDGSEYQVFGGQAIRPEDGVDLLLSIRLADVLRKIDLTAISTTTTISSSNRVSAATACPLIDASAEDLYTCFRKGLEQEADFGKDTDGDHELGSDDEDVEVE